MKPETLQAIRDELDLSRWEFARMLDVKLDHLGKMERGQRPIRTVTALAAVALQNKLTDPDA